MATTEKTIEIPAAILKAKNIKYDNSNSDLGATDTQGAIEELDKRTTVGELKTAHGTSIHVTNSKDAPCLVNPYGNTTQNGTPTPAAPIALESTVLSEIKTCRKNLAKINETNWTVGKNYITNKGANGGAYLIETLNLKANTTYYINLLLLSKPTVDTTFTPYFNDVASAYSFGNFQNYDLNKVYTYAYTPTQDEALYYKMWGNANSETFNFQFWISIDEADKAYEPYTESVATLPEPITLNGLDDVKDYIDTKRGVLVQKFNKFVATSSMLNDVIDGTVYINAPLKCKGDTSALCTHYTNVNASRSGYTVYFKDEINATSKEAYKAFLDSNEVEFIYQLAEPIVTPLSDANIKALRELRSFEGITNVFNNANAEMKFIYATTDNSVVNMENNKEVFAHTSDKSNPHGVTKSQVGLGNVPNVATNDQTPTYTAASSNTALASGEKLSVAMGKIAKAISSLISHLSNKSNPHSVTKAQVGLGNVDNTADANKSVKSATSATKDDLGNKISDYYVPKNDLPNIVVSVTATADANQIASGRTGDYMAMLSNLIPEGYKFLCMTDCHTESSDGSFNKMVDVFARVGDVNEELNVIDLEYCLNNSTTMPINCKIAVTFLFIKK